MDKENLNKDEIDSDKLKNKQIFAQNLIFFRKNLNISQKEMSEQLGTSNKNISKWENAETIPDVFTIKKIAELFKVTIDTLVTPMTDDNKLAIQTKKIKPLKFKIYVLLMVNAILLFLTCIAVYALKSSNVNSFQVFYLYLYILPLMDISVFIFICVVKKKADPISLSIFGWLVAICFYLTFKNVNNIQYIFIITIAYQIFTPIFTKIINSRKILDFNKSIIAKIKRKDGKE